ncbi:MAG: hypothetical protein J0G99_11630 [Alphaproteobacteria bacterium]|nr:hypothetical protein [Alphaproteobacteria bacterium]
MLFSKLMLMVGVTGVALAGVTGAFAAPAVAAPKCLKLRDIQGAKSDDGKILKFTLRDGRVLYNYLQGTCPTLKFNGFEWVIRGADEVCEGQQSLRVLQTNEICVLGKFGAPPKPKADR